MYIQPPQAASSQGRGGDTASTRREKKKHSRDRRHKESVELKRERDRERERERDRYDYRGVGGGARDVEMVDQRYHQHHQHRSERAKHHLSHAYHYQPQAQLPLPQSYAHAHHHHHHQQQQLMSLSRGGTRADYYHSSRHVDYMEVEQPSSRKHASKHGYEQTKDAESLEQDLRSRLLSKRHKYVKDYELEENYEQQQLQQQQQSHSRRKERESRRGSHSHKVRHHDQVIDLLDSPEQQSVATSAAHHQHRSSSKHSRRAEAEAVVQRHTSNDPELLARREKILAAEREKSLRKQIAREELEARREQLQRERNEHSDALSPSTVAASVTAGLNIVKRKHVQKQHAHHERRKRSKQETNEETNEEDEDESEESNESESDEEEESDGSEDETGSAASADSEQSEGHKKERSKRKHKHEDDDDDVPLPDSPLSVGDLYKSPKQRPPRSRSASSHRSQRSASTNSNHSRHSRSRSHSSRSRSPSRSRSRSPASSLERERERNRPQRSRSSSTHSEERGDVAVQEQEEQMEAESSAAKKLALEDLPPCDDKGIPLPNYYPGVQGCRSVEEFQHLNRIEEGTYGVVYRAKDKRTNEIVALKRLKMEKEKEGFPITSLREINTLLKGQHPNIVTVREIVIGSNMDKIYIVMDYVEHDLKSLMETMKQRKQSFFPGEVKCLAQQLLLAVAHLHDNWILHRDLKTSNLLLSHKGILKVGDFGLAREYGSPLKKYTSLVVTLWYRAPELLLCSPEYSTPIDVWSVGCIFAEFLQMAPLFPGKSEIDELNRIFKVSKYLNLEVPFHFLIWN